MRTRFTPLLFDPFFLLTLSTQEFKFVNYTLINSNPGYLHSTSLIGWLIPKLKTIERLGSDKVL